MKTFDINLKGKLLSFPCNENGMICLTDVHKALGGKPSRRPGFWMILRTTKNEINYMISKNVETPIDSSKGKKTWAHPFLALSYAQWYSVEMRHLIAETYWRLANGNI